MIDNTEFTTMYKKNKKEKSMTREEVIFFLKEALESKGYNAQNQIVGYLISGDPTYITNQNDARTVATMYERDELLEEIVEFYIKKKGINNE